MNFRLSSLNALAQLLWGLQVAVAFNPYMHGNAPKIDGKVPKFEGSAFDAILSQRTTTGIVFEGVPLAQETSLVRGNILTKLARKIDEQSYPNAVFVDAKKGLNKPYHWQRDGKRIVSRSSQIKWNAGQNCWSLQFSNIQPTNFDELILSVYRPDGIYLFRYKDDNLFSTMGKQKGKQQIHLRGPAWEKDWARAFDENMMPVLHDKGCDFLDFIEFDDQKLLAAKASYTPSFTTIAYDGVPLADCSPKVRGDLLTKIAREVDVRLHPSATIEDAVAGYRVDGVACSFESTDYDWLRDGKRIACKSSQLRWVPEKYWKLQFTNVKFDSCDELLLVAYTPRGCYFYRHHQRAGVCTKGKETLVHGNDINVYGLNKLGVTDWEYVLDKLDDEMGCKCFARVTWP